MKYYLKQLFCIHDFYYFPVKHKVYNEVCQVIRKCLKCDKEKIYQEYRGDGGAEELSIETARRLNGFRQLKNNQSN